MHNRSDLAKANAKRSATIQSDQAANHHIDPVWAHRWHDWPHVGEQTLIKSKTDRTGKSNLKNWIAFRMDFLQH